MKPLGASQRVATRARVVFQLEPAFCSTALAVLSILHANSFSTAWLSLTFSAEQRDGQMGRMDEKIRKLDEQLMKHRDVIKKTRPGPAQDAAKRRALNVSLCLAVHTLYIATLRIVLAPTCPTSAWCSAGSLAVPGHLARP